jgi:outer membrane protein assembly factor BamD (BamD/ComL family)
MQSGLKLIRILATAFIIVASGQAVLAQTEGNASLRKDISEGLELIFQGSYADAARRFDELSRNHPLSPAGDFYNAVALTWKSYTDAAKLDQGNRDNDDAIEAFLVSAIKKAERERAARARSKAEDVEALYYLGSAQAIRSRLSLYQNHAIPAARAARAAQNYFDELIKLDPDYTDAYFASGSIYYQVGLLTDSPVGKVATAVLGAKSLPVGDRERGLQYLKIAAERAPLARVDAQLSLLEIYTFKENNFDLAEALARKLYEKYPDNQTFARYLLRIYQGQKNRVKLNEVCKRVLARVKENRPNFGPFMKAEAERFMAAARRL